MKLNKNVDGGGSEGLVPSAPLETQHHTSQSFFSEEGRGQMHVLKAYLLN